MRSRAEGLEGRGDQARLDARFDIFQFPFQFNPGTKEGNVETSVDSYGLVGDS
jgi:hypothetical protein